MNWGEANHIHSTLGHDAFIMAAALHTETSGTFLWNVCTNQRCTVQEDFADKLFDSVVKKIAEKT